MTVVDRAWLPTTRGESVVAFTLTVLLLANTTVLLLLATGELDVSYQGQPDVADAGPQSGAVIEPVKALADDDAMRERVEPAGVQTPDRFVQPVESVRRVSPKPQTPLKPGAVNASAAVSKPDTNIQPNEVESEEPAPTFFGIPLD